MVKDILAMAKDLWYLWVPGGLVGVLAGYFLAFWPVVTLLTIIGILIILFFSNAFGLTGEGGGLAAFFLCMILIGFSLGMVGTAILVGTIPITMIPVPELKINWRSLFR